MLMLTHSWLLEHFLGAESFNAENQDLYVYNICPDFLPIRKGFTSERTHAVSRFREIQPRYAKAAFIHFHLMVDDISHHGVIDKIPVTVFNPDSKGYTYIKGKPLIQPLMELYDRCGTPINASVSAYRSHMIIEMMFDLVLHWAIPEESNKLISHMCEAVQRMTQMERLDEFSETVGWLYNADPNEISEAMQQCANVYTLSRMNGFMNLEGRIKVFMSKFGLEPTDDETFSALKGIMMQGMDLVEDCKAFLDPTLDAIRKVGFNPTTLI